MPRSEGKSEERVVAEKHPGKNMKAGYFLHHAGTANQLRLQLKQLHPLKTFLPSKTGLLHSFFLFSPGGGEKTLGPKTIKCPIQSCTAATHMLASGIWATSFLIGGAFASFTSKRWTWNLWAPFSTTAAKGGSLSLAFERGRHKKLARNWTSLKFSTMI